MAYAQSFFANVCDDLPAGGASCLEPEGATETRKVLFGLDGVDLVDRNVGEAEAIPLAWDADLVVDNSTRCR